MKEFLMDHQTAVGTVPSVIQDWDLSNVRARVLKEGEVSEENIDETIKEYRRFFALIAQHGGGFAMMSPAVDSVWHAHILFTLDYATFCDQAFGRFIHHNPATTAAPIGQEAIDRFYDLYKKTFGPIPRIWQGSIAFADCSDACTHCSDIPCSDTDPGCDAGDGTACQNGPTCLPFN